MLTQNPEKVKTVAKRMVQKLGKGLTMPEKKFVLEMILGMLRTGSCNVTRIAAALGEDTKMKHTLKRLQRMLTHEQILDKANQASLKEAVAKINDRTVLALDGGDIVHQYGWKFEYQTTVLDGSSKEKKPGYWLNQVSGYDEKTQETFPILLDIFSTKEPGFESYNKETLSMIERVESQIGNKGLWVMDRGYDAGKVLEYMLAHALTFVVRMRETRDIWVEGKKCNIREVAERINRRVKFSSFSRFGSIKASLKLGYEEYEVTLIAYKGKRNPDVMMLLTPGWIKSTVELKRRIRGYFRRWGVEESYRFEKQGFGLEQATLRRYARVKTMLGLTLLSWLSLVKINENSKLRSEVNRSARMEKNRSKNMPRFIYYRLLLGVKNMLGGIRRLFLWRGKRKLCCSKQNKKSPLLPFMPQPHSTRFELEYAS